MAKKTAAADLISRAKDRAPRSKFTAGMKAEIAKILEYNDSARRAERVTQADILTMLQDDFGLTVGARTLGIWIRAEFGRGLAG